MQYFPENILLKVQLFIAIKEAKESCGPQFDGVLE